MESTVEPVRLSGYRADLDGLRAVAVLPVLIYHFALPGLPGGFVGVDVFFVLSGFFITSLLVSDLDRDRFSILRFYERRARRILPALFVVLLVTSILAVGLLVPDDLVEYARSMLWTLGFGSNFHFWLSSGYFDTAAELKPLLHTWSLAVEEQFYIFFPPLLWGLYRLRRQALIPCLLLLAMLSFALCIWAAYTHAIAGFYLPVTRAWELLAGAMLAVAGQGASGRWSREIASIGGLALILGSMALITPETPFPGWAALFPVAGCVALIWSVRGKANQLLKTAPLVFVGKISYSLYLWHWPVVAYYRYAFGHAPDPLAAIAMILGCILISAFSWRFIEQPFRGRTSAISARGLVLWATGGFAVLGAVSVPLLQTDGLPSRFSPQVLTYLAKTPEVVPVSCFDLPSQQVAQGKACLIGRADGTPSFAIWGDSHGSRIAEGLQEVGAARGLTGLDFVASSCPPLLGVDWPKADCRAFNDAAIAELRKRGIRTVFLSALWASYSEGTTFGRSGSPHYVTDERSQERSLANNRRVFADSLNRTVAALKQAGIRPVIIGPVPEIGWTVPPGLARDARFGTTSPLPTRAMFEARQATVLRALDRIAAAGVEVIWPHRLLCAERCRVEADGRALYIDDNHLSREGVRTFEPQMAAALDTAH